MAKPWDITGDDLARWSQQHDAAAVLPDLVRRLLLATAKLSSLSMAAHAGTRLAGWDGVVNAMYETAFCPDGLSVWELTVQDEKSKLDDDLAKRTADPQPFTPRGTTYVALSARRLSKKLKIDWAAEQCAKKIWKDVRVLDGEDLAAWLGLAPAVARWFATHLRRPVGDIDDLESFLRSWSRRTRPPLPSEILLVGEERRLHAERVRAWARNAGRDARPLRIHAHTKDEALVFAAAALASDTSPDGEQVRARTLIVRSEEALRWALSSDAAEPLIILPLLDRQASPMQADGPLILPLEGLLPSGAKDVLSLAPAPFARFIEILTRAGLSEQEARMQAQSSGGNLASLQRLLGYIELPRWAEGADAISLSAMLLVGEFQPDNQDDRAVLKQLGADPREVELLCERLRLSPDAPTHKEQGRTYRAVWKWSAPGDAWNALVGQIPADMLRSFATVVRSVLGERDPSLDLPPNERFAAAMHKKVLPVSGSLREGLVRSLVRLALHDEALAVLHGSQRGSRLAVAAVRDLLPPPWSSWASLAGLLPLLAEAAPDTFLDCVESSLREGEQGVAHLLAEESSMGSSPHTGLLWALETLGWEEMRMPRVASVLARLAQHDAKLEKPGRLSNRPKNSLAGLLRLALPQTLAPAEARIREMQRRLTETPDVGFPLMVTQIRSVGDIALLTPSHTPQIRLVSIPSREEQHERMKRESGSVYRAYLEMMLDHAGHNSDSWADMLETLRMSPDLASPILDRLERDREHILDNKARLWAGIRHVLHWASLGSEGEDADARRDIFARWQRLYTAFKPKDHILRHAWLFAPRVELPELHGARRDLTAEHHKISELCDDAIKDIWSSGDRIQIIVDLAAEATDRLGSALGRSPFVEELDSFLLDHSPPESLASQLPMYVGARQKAAGRDWVEHKLRSMLDQGRAEDVNRILLTFVTCSATWDLVDALGPDVRRSYWSKLEYVLHEQQSPEDWERAIKSFLEAGNVAAAVKNAEWAKENISPETLAKVLDALVTSPIEAKRFARDQVAEYTLDQLLSRLESSLDADAKYSVLLANAEFLYALVADEPKRSMRHLSAMFAADPDQYIALVGRMYRPDGESEQNNSKAEKEEEVRLAETSYRVLDAWKGYPGEGLPAQAREALLYEWALKSLRSLAMEGHAHTGAIEVARVLERAPDGDDERWPCVAARRLLELNEFPDLDIGLRTAKHNARGMTGRSVGEGGAQEREIATTHRDAARALRSEWPRTADMLDGIAQEYETDALGEDTEAQATLRKYGAEPGDFGARPTTVSPTPNRRVVSPGIVQLESITLRDFTFFEKLTLSLKPPNEERGQWLILLGDNGRGKSSLLRAIALALAGTNVTQSMLGLYPAPLIRIGQTSSDFSVTSGGQKLSVHLADEGTGVVATCDPPNGARPLLFGYGCRRGSALGGNEVADLGGPSSSVITLFSETARLTPAPSWLQRLKLRALQDSKHAHVFDTVTKKLCSLLRDVERMDVVDDQVWAIAPKLGGRLPLAALSDGYLSTLGWIVDMMARWLHWAEQVDFGLEGSFFDRMEGLVLLDEIDLYLHPLWQRDIVADLKEAFPRLSFVVTTHNPLTLLGAEAGEIVVLRDAVDGRKRTEALQLDLPRGIRADRVLTGEWFGLPSTVDDDTAALYERHQKMLLAQAPESDPARLEIEEQLRDRLGTFADTSLDRMALEVAADLMRESRPRTAADRQELQRKLKERVKARMAEQESRGGPKS